MRVHEVLAADPLLKMSYSRKKAEAVITGLEKPINDHLLKLLAIADDHAEHWTKELLEWLDEVAEIRLKPDNEPAPAAFYYRVLFDEPFGGTGVTNVARRIRRLERQGYTVRQNTDLDQTLERLRGFHKAFAEACSNEVEADAIEAMLLRVRAAVG